MGQNQVFSGSPLGFCLNCGANLESEAKYCPSCGTPVGGAAGQVAHGDGVPVRLFIHNEFAGPLSDNQLVLNRILLFVKWIFAIPLYILGGLYGLAAFIVIFISFWAILFTGRYPKSLFDFARGYLEFQFRILAYFPLLLTNHWTPDDWHPLRVEVDYPASCSRLVLMFLKLPSFLLGVVTNLSGVAIVLLFLLSIPAWFFILFTGRYPSQWFATSHSMLQWSCRVDAWQYLMRDDATLFGTTTPVRVIVGIGLVISFFIGILLSSA